MTVTSPPPLETSRVQNWTPRQREVLDLVMRGRTNREIAEELGISLDGAKWHVSEIITRLGVGSREEAAEYWRHQNGMRMRFTRMAGFATSGALKWTAATVAASALVFVSAMVIFALRESGGEGEQHAGGGIETPGTTGASPSPVVTGTPPATTTTTVPNPTGEVINGVPVSGLVFGAPGSLPVPMSVIVEKGCYQCDGPSSGFERVTLDANGKLKVEPLYKPATGYILSSNWDPAGREHYLSICSRGYCGGVGQISADAQTTIMRSTDGGVSWQALETFDGDVTVAARTAQGVLLNRTTYKDGVFDYRFQVLGTSQFLTPPAGAQPEYIDTRLIGWRLSDGKTIQGLDGSTLVVLPDLGLPQGKAAPMRIEGILATGDLLVSWYVQSDQASYIGLIKGGKLTAVFKGSSDLSVGAFVSQSIAFGNVTLPKADGTPTGAPLYPVILDLGQGTLNVLELYGAVGSDAYNGQRNRIRLVEPGPFLRVTGDGDCLNVRESPSTIAKVLGCFADNVLLHDLNEEQIAGGTTWKKVQTPAGVPGWASKDFLTR